MERIMIVLDTSVLISFLGIERIDLLKRYAHGFVITDHVAVEIADHFPDQQVRLKGLVSSGFLRQVTVSGKEELSVFRELSDSDTLGRGECSAISFASCRNLSLAIDGKCAEKLVRKLKPDLQILNSLQIMESLTKHEMLDVQESKEIMTSLELFSVARNKSFDPFESPHGFIR